MTTKPLANEKPQTMSRVRAEFRRMRQISPLTTRPGLRCWIRFAAVCGQAYRGKAAQIAEVD